MQIVIRKMRTEDRQAVEHICLATAPSVLNSTAKMREYTLLLYNRYYTRTPKDSFVAVNADDEPMVTYFAHPIMRNIEKAFLKMS